MDNTEYAASHERLKKIILKPESFNEAVELALKVHKATHMACVSECSGSTIADNVWQGLDEKTFRAFTKRRKFTIAWHMWHIARIEDIVGNILIAGSPQVYNSDWAAKLKNIVTDTGNAMTDSEVAMFSNMLDMESLLKYRNSVGKRTREIINALQPGDMKRKPSNESADRIMEEGGLTMQKGSFWLKDFWAAKTIGGLVLLPLTRHHMMHLPACIERKDELLNK